MDLTLCNGHNAIFTCIDRSTKYCRRIPCFVVNGALSAFLFAKLFFDNIVRFFGIPAEIIPERDP